MCCYTTDLSPHWCVRLKKRVNILLKSLTPSRLWTYWRLAGYLWSSFTIPSTFIKNRTQILFLHIPVGLSNTNVVLGINKYWCVCIVVYRYTGRLYQTITKQWSHFPPFTEWYFQMHSPCKFSHHWLLQLCHLIFFQPSVGTDLVDNWAPLLNTL